MHAGYGFCVVGLIDVATDKALVFEGAGNMGNTIDIFQFAIFFVLLE